MNHVKFLGTAGARYTVMRQLRSSAGTWIALAGMNILVDPGPGTLVRCAASRPKLDPARLDAIVLTHRHIDHSNDVNIMIEAMTEAGKKPRGILFAPAHALDADPVVLNYVRGFVERIAVLKEGGKYTVGPVEIETPVRHVHHGAETYGLNIRAGNTSISIVSDTRYFDALSEVYTGDVAVLNVVLFDRKPGTDIEHLSLADAEKFIVARRPKLAILTHFGMGMLREKPRGLAMKLQEKTGVCVRAASDGMTIDLDNPVE
jgi:phosphoribosyl 1,2-cyclic phosphodiesterase